MALTRGNGVTAGVELPRGSPAWAGLHENQR